ncbi:MAG: hypothetical protein JST85_17100 [Acidobacteria bacterium]|nr:hypothetical protein [Acidobacteriota bacterium]
MQLNKFLTIAILSMLVIGLCAGPASAWQKKTARPKSDPVSGDWNTSLVSASSGTFTLLLKLKQEAGKVTGSYESNHIGSGKISNGTWAANKLNVTLESSHGPITLEGQLKQGKLMGKFNSGPMQGPWQASKK